MRIVFFGTAEFAVPALRAVAPDAVLVVSQPDRPCGRGMRLQCSPVKQAADELGLPSQCPEKCRSAEFVECVRGLNPDVLLVAAYGQILSQDLLDSARLGGINLHGSILPEYRGAAPIQRCLLDGRSKTGVTVMHMDRGMDTGDVVAFEEVDIGPDETYGELQCRLAALAAKMARKWLPRILDGSAPRTPQDHSKATYAPKVLKGEACLSFSRSARQEYNRYRAFTPSPGACLMLESGNVKISRAALSDGQGEPGEVLGTSPNLTIAFESGAIEFIEIQPEGKKRMSGRDYANGARLKPGVVLKEL